MEEQLDRHLLRIIHAAAETIQTCRYGETIQIKRDLYTIMNLEQSKSTSKQQSKHERFQLFHKSCKSLKFTFLKFFPPVAADCIQQMASAIMQMHSL